MDNLDRYKLASILAAAGAWMMFAAFRRFLRARKVADTAACPVGSMPAGFGESQGVAWPCKIFKDSFGNDTAYLEQCIEEHVKRGKSSSWVVRSRFNSHEGVAHFYILDNSGLAKIFPQKASTSLKETKRSWSSLTTEQTKFVLANACGVVFPSAGVFGFSRWRVREKRIIVANPLLVQGNFSRYPAGLTLESATVSYLRNKLGRFLNPLARATLPFDFNRDGRVDEKEMRLGISGLLGLAKKFEDTVSRSSASGNSYPKSSVSVNSVTQNEAPGDAVSHQHPVYGEFREHPQHQLFFADVHQRELLRRMGSWNMLLFVVGACAIGGALYFAFGKMR